MIKEESLNMLFDDWFLKEPAFFALLMQQELAEQVHMECPIRCGQGKIEYNPLLLKHRSYKEVEELMRIELIRLFLKHPYDRQPSGCCKEAIAAGSDVTIADGYCLLKKEKLPLRTPGFYHLPLGQYFEWYAKAIDRQTEKDRQKNNQPEAKPDKQPSSQSNEPSNTPQDTPQSDADKSALWREDSLQRQRIDQLIERTTDWGTIPADIVERIQASTRARLDNRMVWQGFCSSVLSSHRQLTRMRPNRRAGFLQMGSTRQFDTHLLVAIDVSGSVTSEMLQDFYSAINRMFRYGVAQLDLCQFDAVMGEIKPMKLASSQIEVKGRGGTNFQPVIDFVAQHPEYDGLMILTDGEAPIPKRPPHLRTHILWVCHDEASYQANKDWMTTLGRVAKLG